MKKFPQIIIHVYKIINHFFGDRVTVEAAEACKRYGVGVKCATITPNAKRMEEYHLHKMWKSPNGTIRSILDGTVFRTPITIPSIHPVVKNWERPITIARHAYGDVYKNVELRVDEPGTAKLVFEGKSGKRQEAVIHQFEGPGVIQGMHNVDRSIRSFAHSCFQFALDTHQDLWFATKDTISKTYDAQFREIFEELYENAPTPSRASCTTTPPRTTCWNTRSAARPTLFRWKKWKPETKKNLRDAFPGGFFALKIKHFWAKRQ